MPGREPASRLRGRDEELGVLRRALDRVERGAPAAVIVEGEAGIGKSALLAEILDEARARRFAVFSGHAQELERARPFGLWVEVLGCSPTSADPARVRIAELLAPPPRARHPLTVTSDPGLQFQAIDAFVDLVEDVAHDAPVLIGLDDLQWADSSSLLTLASLARRLAHAPVLLLGCLRPPPRGHELDRALAALEGTGAGTVRLGALAAADVAGLVADVLGARPGPALVQQVAGAGGNPLFVTELLAAIGQEGVVRTADGHADVRDTALPPSLGLTILRHLSVLPERTLEVLRLASILGVAFTVSDLSATSGRPVVSLSSALSEAVAAGVLAEDGYRLRFRHDLMRDAVYDDLPLSVRQGLHAEAGERLARAGGSALQVAEHLLRGAPGGAGDTVEWVRHAAREAVARSPAAAAALLERAAGTLARTDPQLVGLQTERAGSLLWAGRTRDAEDLCRELLAGGLEAAEERAVLVVLAQALIVEGRVAEGLQQLERIEDSPAVGAGVRAWTSMARVVVGDLDGAAATARAVLSTDAARTDDLAAGMALAALAVAAELRGDLHHALDLIDEAASRTGEPAGHRYPAHVTRGHILIELDRFDEAMASVGGWRPGERSGRRSASPGPVDHSSWHAAPIILGVGHFAAGEWDDAVAALETGLALADETGQTSSSVLGESVLALIALHRGDLPGATRAVGRATAQTTVGGPVFRGEWAAWARALLLEAGGDVTSAFTLLAESWDRCAQRRTCIEFPLFGPDLVRLAQTVGDPARAEAVVEVVEGLAATHDVPGFRASALRCRGLVEQDPQPLLAAVEAYARSGRTLSLALAAEETARALRYHDAPSEARALLDRAVAAFEELDAARDVARVEAQLRGLGVHRGRRGSRARPRTGWESLTPTERRVVELVAEGLSNPQVGARLYLSRRTVQTHLAHVFAKLEVSSRAQLAAEVARRADG